MAGTVRLSIIDQTKESYLAIFCPYLLIKKMCSLNGAYICHLTTISGMRLTISRYSTFKALWILLNHNAWHLLNKSAVECVSGSRLEITPLYLIDQQFDEANIASKSIASPAPSAPTKHAVEAPGLKLA